MQTQVNPCSQSLQELIGSLEAREKEIFLKLLVVIFDKAANNSRRLGQSFWREILLRIEPAQCFAVNQEHAL